MRNQVLLIGNVGKSPEISAKTKDGKPVVRFAIAQDVSALDPVSNKFVKRDPQWFQISSFGFVAEKSLSLVKGDLVQVTGRLKSSSFTNDKGEKRTSIEIVADEIFKLVHVKKASFEANAAQDVSSPDQTVDFEAFEEGVLQ